MAADVLEHLTASLWGFHSLAVVAINPPCDWRGEVMRGHTFADTQERTRFSVNNAAADPGDQRVCTPVHQRALQQNRC